MTYRIHTARRAADYLRRLDARSQARILQRLDEIAADPYGPHTKPLTGVGGQRVARVGGWRIVFAVDTAARIVNVNAIRPRGEVYRRL